MLLSLLFSSATAQFAPAYQHFDAGSPVALEAGELAVELPISAVAMETIALKTAPGVASITLDIVTAISVTSEAATMLLTSGHLEPSLQPLTSEHLEPSLEPLTSEHLEPSLQPLTSEHPVHSLEPLTTTPEHLSLPTLPANTSHPVAAVDSSEPIQSDVYLVDQLHDANLDETEDASQPLQAQYAPTPTDAPSAITSAPVYSMRPDELFDMVHDYAKAFDYQPQEMAVQTQVPLGSSLVIDHTTTSDDALVEYYGDAYLTFDWMREAWSYSLSSDAEVSPHSLPYSPLYSANNANRLAPAIVEWVYRFI